MRKLVLFLFIAALFLLYPCVSDSPIAERISTGEVLERVKSFFAFQQICTQEKTSDEGTYLNAESQAAKNYGAGEAEDESTENLKSNLAEDELDLSADEENHNTILEPTAAPQKNLDLTLPQLVNDEQDMIIFKHENKSILPDLFRPSVVKEEDERTSFGGRILMEEGFEELEEYRLQDIRGSIEGAELTLEVKTN